MSIDLTFPVAPFGLEPLRSFVLEEVEGATGLFALVGDGTTAAVHPPELSDEQVDVIALASAEEAMLLVVANPDEGGTTVNLLAPVVVNARTGVGAQFILEDQDLPLRAELARS
jgi:flagellar assembly factor FliW